MVACAEQVELLYRQPAVGLWGAVSGNIFNVGLPRVLTIVAGGARFSTVYTRDHSLAAEEHYHY